MRSLTEAVTSKHSSAKQGWARKPAILATSLVLAFFVAELAVRWLVPVRNIGPTLTQYDPVFQKRLKRNFSTKITSPEFSMRISTNSLGLRGPEPPRPCRNAILFLGDSFCMGYGVSDGDEYPQRVGKLLDKQLGDRDIPIINAGIGATGNGHWIKFLRDEAESFDPSFVVLQASSNDFGENKMEGLFALSAEEALIELEVPPPSWVRKGQGLVEAVPGVSRSHLVGLARQAALAWQRRPVAKPSHGNRSAKPATVATNSVSDPTTASDELTFALIGRSLEMCREKKWRCLLLSVGIQGARAERLGELADERNVVLLTAPSKSQRPDLYFEVDGHWNATGHQYLAEMLTSHLLKTKIFVHEAMQPASAP